MVYTLLSALVVSAATSARPFCRGNLVFLLFKGKLIKHANHRTRLGAVVTKSMSSPSIPSSPPTEESCSDSPNLGDGSQGENPEGQLFSPNNGGGGIRD